MPNILNRVIKYNIYVLVFLIPLFFLPFSFEAFEYSKQYLLFFLVSLTFFVWLAKQVIYEKEIRIRISPLDLFVLGFLAMAILSAIFSVDRTSSLYGFYGRFSNGLIGLLSLGVFYFLVTNNIRGSKEEEKGNIFDILKIFLCSSGLVALVGYLSVFQVWQKIGNFWPRIMTQITFNPASGSLEGLAVFLSMVVVLLVGLILSNSKEQETGGKKKLFFLYSILFVSLGMMVIVDFTPAWLILLVTLLLIVGFSMWKRLFRKNVNRLLIPILLIIIAGALIPFQPVKMGLPREQVLPQQISWQIAFDSSIENVKSGFLGTGIGTFHYDFIKHKPQLINQSWFWSIRFDRGFHFAEILGTMGFLGFLSYLILIGMFFIVFWLLIGEFKKDLKEGDRGKILPLLMVFLALIVGQFFYYQNTTLAFLFWLFLSLGVVFWQKPIREKVVSFKDFPELSLVLSALVVILGISILVFYFYAGNFYWADVNYTKGISLLGDERLNKLETAVSLNPQLASYRLALARAYLYEVLTAKQDSAKIQLYVSRAIDQAKTATLLQPNFVANWETLGMIYWEIRGVATGALDWGIKYLGKAIELEPTNPVLYTELGELYAQSGNNEKAKEYFNKAIEKKPDYADALIQKALLLEKENILDGAIKELENVVIANPLNIEALFQLGRLYFNQGRADESIELFKRVAILVPNHSNAHYSLGVVYASQGETRLAIEELEKVLELNPGNQDVIQKLEELRGK